MYSEEYRKKINKGICRSHIFSLLYGGTVYSKEKFVATTSQLGNFYGNPLPARNIS